jgi:hypothetical protein
MLTGYLGPGTGSQERQPSALLEFSRNPEPIDQSDQPQVPQRND